MKVIITAATQMEWQNIREKWINMPAINQQQLQVLFHTSGVGLLSTSYALTKVIDEEKPGLVVQVGIAGALDNNLQLGEVVMVNEDCVGDLVVEENGHLIDMFDLGLQQPGSFPYQNSKLVNPWMEKFDDLDLQQVASITINEITTRPSRIQQFKDKYSAAIETMEGAALHYVALQTHTPFLQVKAISNYVGERNKANWKMKEALESLSAVALQLLEKISNNHIQLK